MFSDLALKFCAVAAALGFVFCESLPCRASDELNKELLELLQRHPDICTSGAILPALIAFGISDKLPAIEYVVKVGGTDNLQSNILAAGSGASLSLSEKQQGTLDGILILLPDDASRIIALKGVISSLAIQGFFDQAIKLSLTLPPDEQYFGFKRIVAGLASNDDWAGVEAVVNQYGLKGDTDTSDYLRDKVAFARPSVFRTLPNVWAQAIKSDVRKLKLEEVVFPLSAAPGSVVLDEISAKDLDEHFKLMTIWGLQNISMGSFENRSAAAKAILAICKHKTQYWRDGAPVLGMLYFFNGEVTLLSDLDAHRGDYVSAGGLFDPSRSLCVMLALVGCGKIGQAVDLLSSRGECRNFADDLVAIHVARKVPVDRFLELARTIVDPSQRCRFLASGIIEYEGGNVCERRLIGDWIDFRSPK